MENLTFAELKALVNEHLDLEDEIWIDDSQLVGHMNEAIRKAEAFIHTLNWGKKHYFLTPKKALALTNGSPFVPLPSDIYASKIVLVMWDNGPGERYQVMPTKSRATHHDDNSGARYKYEIVNSNSEGTTANNQPHLYITPAAEETTSTKMYLWYLRIAKRLTTDLNDADNYLDIPQAVNFVVAHARMMCLAKPGEAMWKFYKEQRDEEYDLLVSTLEQMVVDENTFIDPDMTYYADMVGGFYPEE